MVLRALITKTVAIFFFTLATFCAVSAGGTPLRRASMGAAAFTPASDPQLQVWFTGSDAGSITQSGGLVSQWNDKSSNALNATQSDDTQKPGYVASGLNSRPVLSFNGTSTLPFPTNAVLSTGSQFAVYVVLKHTTINAGTLNIFLGLADGSAQPPYFNYNQTAGTYQFIGPSAAWKSVEAAASPGTSNYHLLAFLYNGAGATTAGNFSIYLDRSLLTTSGIATSDFAENNVIGTYRRLGGTAGLSLKGNVAELIVTHSTSTRADVEAYVGRVWGI